MNHLLRLISVCYRLIYRCYISVHTTRYFPADNYSCKYINDKSSIYLAAQFLVSHNVSLIAQQYIEQPLNRSLASAAKPYALITAFTVQPDTADFTDVEIDMPLTL